MDRSHSVKTRKTDPKPAKSASKMQSKKSKPTPKPVPVPLPTLPTPPTPSESQISPPLDPTPPSPLSQILVYPSDPKSQINSCRTSLEHQRIKLSKLSSLHQSEAALLSHRCECVHQSHQTHLVLERDNYQLISEILEGCSTAVEQSARMAADLEADAEKDRMSAADAQAQLQRMKEVMERREEKEEDEAGVPEDELERTLKRLQREVNRSQQLKWEIQECRNEKRKMEMILNGDLMREVTKMLSEVEKITGKVQEINMLERMMNGEKIKKEDVEMSGGSMVGEWSVKPHILVDKLTILKGQINVLSTLIQSDKLKQEVKTKRKSQEPQSTTQKDETREEINQLTAEKNRLESYLKVYTQRINSLSTFKSLFARLKSQEERLSNPNIQYKLKADEDDSDSFSQYDLNSEVQSTNSKVVEVKSKELPSKTTGPTIAEMTEIITLK